MLLLLTALVACEPASLEAPPAVEAPTAPEASAGYEYVTLSAESMGTLIQVTVPAGGALRPEEAAEIVFEVFREVDALASEWKEGSPLTAVNRAAGGQAVAVPAELLTLVQRSLELGALTDGAFDITWAALWGVWDFKAEAPSLPDPALLAERLALVDYRLVEVHAEAGTLRLPRAGMLIGMGGVAKGYALDKAGAALREAGVDSFHISAGGQILAGGLAHHRGEAPRPWRVGIRDPRGAPDDFFASVEATDVSVSTSGDYERYFMLDGVRYHHIIDLRTGQPSRRARSATVIAQDATLADAWSTALMVLGPEGLARLADAEGVEAVVVDDQGGVHRSAGLSPALLVRHPPLPGTDGEIRSTGR